MDKLKRIIAHPVFLTLISCFIIIQTGYAVPSPSPSPSPSPNNLPSITLDSSVSEVYAGESVSIGITATDADGDTLELDRMIPKGASLTITENKPGLINATFDWAPTNEQAGTCYRIGFKVWDGQGGSGTSIVICVKAKPSYLGTITGIVTDAQTGKPIANATVFINGAPHGDNQGVVSTDAQGRFSATVPRYVITSDGQVTWLRYTVNIGWAFLLGYHSYTSSELAFSETTTIIEHNVAPVPLTPGVPTGTLSGQVIDANTKKPIANAYILIKPYPAYWGNTTDYATTTDSQGYYKIENVLRGFVSISDGQVDWIRYYVFVSHSVYESYGGSLVFSALVYDVVEDIQLETHPVTLSTGTITGIVTDAQTGKPIANGAVYIRASYVSGDDYKVITDSQGRFTATVQRSRTSGTAISWCSYKIHIDCWEGYESIETFSLLSFSESISSITCNISLKPILGSTGTISGRVINSITSQPVAAGMQVNIRATNYQGSGETPFYSAQTDAQGNYKITGVKRFYTPPTSSGSDVVYLQYEILISWEGYEYTKGEKLVFSASVFEIKHDISVQPVQSVKIGQDVYLDTSQEGSAQFAKPQVICDDTGYVLAVWQTQADSPQPTGHLRSRTSLDFGLNWEVTREVVSSDMAASRIDDAQLGQDEKGNVYLSWRMTKGNHQYLYVSRALNHGYNWTDDRLVKDTAFLPGKERTVFQTDAPVNSQSPTIHLKCQDNSGRVYILETEDKQDGNSDRVVFTYSLNQGETWNEVVLGEAADFKEAAMTRDNNGNVYIVGIVQNAVVFKAISFRQE